MNIVLVSLNNFQEYILDNIRQLLKLGIKNIYVIIESNYFNKFDVYSDRIMLVNSLELNKNGNYQNDYYYIYELMKQYKLNNVIHIENNVLLYYNPEILLNKLDNKFIYLPYNAFTIIYIPDYNILKNILDNYNFGLKNTGLIKSFPIFHNNHSEKHEKYLSENDNNFNFIFDDGSIEKNINVSEEIIWKLIDNIKKPFLIIDEEIVPIFNLYIHSKNLCNFIKGKELFDIVICVGPNDKEIIYKSIQYTKNNIIDYRNIYLVSFDNNIKIDGTITINESIFPFNKRKIEEIFDYYSDRTGWYLQQLIKLYSGKTIPNILDNYLVIDSDTFFLKPTEFINNDGKFLYNTSNEYHLPYFYHMNRMNSILRKTSRFSGISHHCLFNKKILDELFRLVEGNQSISFWELFLKAVDRNDIQFSGASEYEIYFTFLHIFHVDKFILRELSWKNSSELNKYDKYDFDYVSVHWYLRK